MKEKRKVSFVDAHLLSERNGVAFCREVSAKTGENVSDVFNEIVSNLLKNKSHIIT